MNTSRLARFRVTYYDAGEIKFEAGQHYPLNEETERQIAAGNAELVEVDIDAEKAQKLAIKARAAADRAAAAAAEAEALAAAAVEAQKLADDAAAALDVVTTDPEAVQTPAADPKPSAPVAELAPAPEALATDA